jgi:hypothetical protein
VSTSKLHSLFDKLDAFLGIDSAPRPAPEPEPSFELSTEATAALKKAQSVLMVLMKQVVALNDRMALLRGACEAAGIMPQSGVRVHPELALQVPAIADVLKADPGAARLVASAVVRFAEARADLKELTDAIGAGTVQVARVEQIAMKYVFLCRSALYFQGVPIVNRLFMHLEDLHGGQAKPDLAAAPRPDVGIAPTQAERASRMGFDGRVAGPPTGDLGPRAGLGPSGTDKLGLGTNAPGGARPGQGGAAARGPGTVGLGGRPAAPPPVPKRPLTGGLARPTGPDQLIRTGAKDAPRSPEAMARRMAEQGQLLLKALEIKVAILQVAYDQARGVERATAPLLPVPAQKTARAIAAELQASPGLQPMARQYIQVFLEARGLVPPKGPAQQVRAGKLLAELGTYPQRFKGHVVLEQLFLVTA